MDGIYVSQFSVPRGQMYYTKKWLWIEEFDLDELVFEHNITVQNDLDNELMLSGGTQYGSKKRIRLPFRQNARVDDRTAILRLNCAADYDLLVM